VVPSSGKKKVMSFANPDLASIVTDPEVGVA
jgi:hypothetical protein